MQLQINANYDRGGISIVRCQGRIIYGPETEAFSEMCHAAFSRSCDLVVNLSDVTLIDNHGVGALIGLVTAARPKGCDLCLVLPRKTNKVAEILKLVKLYDEFRVYETEEEAIGSFHRVYAVA